MNRLNEWRREESEVNTRVKWKSFSRRDYYINYWQGDGVGSVGARRSGKEIKGKMFLGKGKVSRYSR